APTITLACKWFAVSSRGYIFVAIMAADFCPAGRYISIYKEEEKTVSQMKKIFSLVLVVGLGAVSGLAYSQSAALTEELKARIAPVGSVCKSGESCAAAPVAVSSGPKSGKEVYDSACTTCHAIGVAGAPKTGSADDWAPRISKGIDTLYTHAIQ